MKLLVTGGAGYIGSIVAHHLLEAGHEVVILDNLRQGHRQAVPAEAKLVVADLLDREVLDAAVDQGFDAVLHFAALALVGESGTHPERYYRTNVAGTLNLLDAMRAAGVGRLVFSSTCAVYGQPDEVPIPETAPTRPENPYGRSKLAVDWMIGDFCRAHGLGRRQPPLLQRRGGEPWHRRGPRSGDPPDPERPSSRARDEPVRRDLRHRLSDPRRDGDPGLHPHRRPRRRAPAGARRHARGRAPDLQPRQRQRLLRPRGDRGGAEGDRGRGARPRGRAPTWRPADAGRRRRSDPLRARAGSRASPSSKRWSPTRGRSRRRTRTATQSRSASSSSAAARTSAGGLAASIGLIRSGSCSASDR